MILITPSAASQLRTMLAERRSGVEGGLEGGVKDQADVGPSAGGSSGGSLDAEAHMEAPAVGAVAAGVGGRQGLRIVVEKGGCAGMQYEMRFDVSGPDDVVSESEGVCVFVDPASARFLEGASLDYCDDLVGTGFRLQNPNAARSCGCGTSFEPLERSESEGRSEAGVEREATSVAHP
jgi:iron-sulfur cluster assembly protein